MSFNLSDFAAVTNSTYTFGTSVEKNGISLKGCLNNAGPKDSPKMGLSKYQQTGGGNWIAVASNANTNITKIIINGVTTGSSKTTKLSIYANSAEYIYNTNNKCIQNPAGEKVEEGYTLTQNKAENLTYSINNKYFILYNSTTTGQITISSIDIYYDATPEDTNKPAAPTFSIDGGEVDANTTVTITGDEKTKSLKYWFDDNDATATTVTGATATVTITKACTLNAIAIGEGGVESTATSATFTVKDPNIIYSNACTTSDCGFSLSGIAGATNPWTIDKTYGLKATGYVGGKNTITEGIICSPLLDLTGRINITLDFDQAVNMFKNGDTTLADDAMSQINNYISIVIAEDNGGMPADWNKLADATLPETQSWTYYAQNPTINLDAYKGKKVYVGFKYASDANMAGTWEIKNVLVKGDEVPELPAPTFEDGDQDVLVNEVDGGWSIRPEKYPVTLKFAVADGVQMYAKAVNAAQAAAEGDNDGYSALEGNALTLTKTGEVYSVYAMKDGVKSEVKTVTADVPSGISSIEAENGEAVYFNLQGVRVENPENGIFIRVQNGKAVKIAK